MAEADAPDTAAGADDQAASATTAEPAANEVRVTALIRVDLEETFRIFTEEIDLWWRRGLMYRVAGKRRGVIAIEPRLGGRLFESFETRAREKVIETGRVTVWEPPTRLVLEWRNVNFRPDESTEVEVRFEPSKSGTSVTIVHRGWAAIRPDHPARHGLGVGAAFIRSNGMWWGGLLSGLRTHAEARRGDEDS
jgi:uncharacterized protein YndB with AHSA1/START domain